MTIHGIDETGHLPYLLMEYIDGLSLQQRIDRYGRLELKEILRIGKQTALGLAAAHTEGLIHRDIKPANILLENGVERVKITDFGLARTIDDVSITKTGVVTGTPQYMSPEQAQNEQVDHRSDLFSLGSVLYAMCTCRPPFRGDSVVAVIRRVCDDTPRPIREVNPEIPAWLVAIIDRLLAKNPNERFQSASEVAELLGKHLAHAQDPTLTSMPVLEPAGKQEADSLSSSTAGSSPSRRRPWVTVAAVLLLLVGTLGLTEFTGVTEFVSTVIEIWTPHGTLIVEVDDPDVSMPIEGSDIVIMGAGPKEIRLKVGEYRLRATKNGKPVYLELVTITRGGKKVVRILLKETKPEPKPGTNYALSFSGNGDHVVIPSLHYDGSHPITIEATVTDITDVPGFRSIIGDNNNNILQRNLVGVGLDGETAVGNGRDGIRIWRAAQDNVIGTDEDGTDDTLEGNIVDHNAGDGVGVFNTDSVGNMIRGNSIHSNTQPGIDLGGDGVTGNDLGDADVGANNLQNFPVLSQVEMGIC